uniref:Uncharacterized protein n=1 Tax=Geospiza parvula TaxID=87175 RepID=A0A8C3N245_GEOPR
LFLVWNEICNSTKTGLTQSRPRRAVVPLQGGRRWRCGGGGGGAAVLPPAGPRLPVLGAGVPRPPLRGRRAGGQRAAERQRAAAVGHAALGAAGSPRRRPARLRAQLLLGRHLHALPLRQRGAGSRVSRLPAGRGARQRALPPVPAAALRPAAPRAARAVRGVPRGARGHARHRGGHDGRGGIHLRDARLHLPARGLHHREPHEPRARPRRARGGRCAPRVVREGMVMKVMMMMMVRRPALSGEGRGFPDCSGSAVPKFAGCAFPAGLGALLPPGVASRPEPFVVNSWHLSGSKNNSRGPQVPEIVCF